VAWLLSFKRYIAINMNSRFSIRLAVFSEIEVIASLNGKLVEYNYQFDPTFNVA